jgi:hypothetical protein
MITSVTGDDLVSRSAMSPPSPSRSDHIPATVFVTAASVSVFGAR